ncbi:Glycosyl transferase family 2 [Dyadobacter koreensis]|uniref:Glycosyl transferase family 2 n=1 Tax=Dyadobacter koreensis TaxID=408657 RepID=A0A1H6R873_9BACT|nr:glycosyltransferase [Dyadobacter koreensis]SEI52021.1 Glycosyl transferase family 2 [Dyadobacter koreensis]
MEFPLVTVLYPVYNDSPVHIHESMNSIINQDYSNLEIIIVDDSNKLSSIEALDFFKSDSRVKILRTKHTGGLPQALNDGLAMASGKYIARADADDIQFPNRIRCQVEFLEKNQSIGILGCNINYIDDQGNHIKMRNYPETDKSIRKYLHLRNPLCHSVVMIRKDIFDKIGTYNTDFKRAEDYELWLRASANKIELHNLQQVLMDYRMATGEKRDKLNWKMNLKLKKKYFSFQYLFESTVGILSIYLYILTPISLQNYIYKKLA